MKDRESPGEGAPPSCPPLDEYLRRRDFTRTPEPRGGAIKPSGNIFVVQKHAARTLHYDLRLEYMGVLKSWAVPKGPGTKPGEKRLAIRVEDHPLEYAGFEGVIPRGEYGAGAVMVWDRGVWVPEGSVEEGLRKGALKFSLLGTKLRGRWALVRIKGPSDDSAKDEWLLIKERDGAKGPFPEDITGGIPLSVESGRRLEEIESAPEALWGGGGAFDVSSIPGSTISGMPDIIRPQLASLTENPPAGDDWLHEIKFDGYRVLARIRHGEVRLFTRAGNDWTGRFPSIAASLLKFPASTAWLDGEVVFVKGDGTSSFGLLQDALSRGADSALIYYLFDIVYYNGYGLAGVPLIKRKGLVSSLLKAAAPGPNIRFSDHLQGMGRDFLHRACGYSLEGIVSKQASSLYTQRRSGTWLKIKCHSRQEFVVGGYTEGHGGRRFGALLTGVFDPKGGPEGSLLYTGRVGTGFDESTLEEIWARLKALESPTPPFFNPPTGPLARGVRWVRPELVIEVEFSEWTRDGVLRQPSFKGLRDDKPATEVVYERPGYADAAPQIKGGADAGKVRLTNPGQILFPDRGLAKKDLAAYYESVSGLMLPHLTGRPLTLVRCPEGYERGCFFQKHIGGAAPRHIRPVEITENGGAQARYLSVDSREGLLTLVQMGVLEIHTWGSRAGKVESPDKIVFDIDPDPEVEWVRLVEAAHLVHEFLLELGLAGFVRTTGGKGLHVVAPLEPIAGWEEVRSFSRSIAEYLARGLPERFTSTMTKTRRKGRIFIDYMRNIRGETAIELYSTRARKGAPIAAPVGWDELMEIRSDSFTVENIRERIEGLGLDPWEGYFEVRQRITGEMRRRLGL